MFHLHSLLQQANDHFSSFFYGVCVRLKSLFLELFQPAISTVYFFSFLIPFKLKHAQ